MSIARRYSELVLVLLTCLVLGCAPEAPPADEPAATAEPMASAGSPGDHVSFFVLGKSWNFTQTADGVLNLIDMGFFAEIFKLAGGEVADARMQLTAPGSEPILFDREGDGGAVLFGHDGNRHQTVEAVDAELPNGDYAFSFSTPGGDIDNFVVTIAGADGQTDLPPAPVISLEQNGSTVASTAVEPGVDTRVSWTPFDTGRADPNGIADDLIFVMMDDCHGKRAFHSGRPLATPNPLEPEKPSESLLTFADNEITMPGSSIKPGTRYTLKVEHARLLDTDKRQGVVGMTTFAVTTFLELQATGDAGPNACPPRDD
ncbi:MAG: hypothetical protein QNJ73_10715 [Gammaproteobacteria bacterium]|nr:hypothetical protein [Gammaproteobacteria bacterium]